MDRLILFRHGKADADSASGEDFDRRLAPGGLTQSAETAARLAEMGLIPDLVLVSPAARTRETWAAAAASFPGARVDFDTDLYNADSSDIRLEAERAGRAASAIMVVGHNPGIHELTVRLLIEGDAPASLVATAQRNFPTAAAAVFLFDVKGRPVFDGLFIPERGD
jgi:phosphohistidine phosphatase